MATKYIHFTEQQKEQARQTDIAEMLRSQGETLRRSGSEYEWRDGSEKGYCQRKFVVSSI